MLNALADFVDAAIHVEKGNETPADQVKMITTAFGCLMDISDWVVQGDDVVIQCQRVAFTEITFQLGERVERKWQQTSATRKQREKLASELFRQKVVMENQLFGNELVYEVTPYSGVYRKPRDTSINARQILLLSAPKVIRPPVRTRKYWGDPWLQPAGLAV